MVPGKPIEALTNVEVARLLLRQLWQWQDVSGVSHGRSYESKILEAAIDLIPLPSGIKVDWYSVKALIEESERRKRIAHQQLMLQFEYNTGAE